MRDDKVDPAALLVAIISAAATPLVTEGAWDRLNTLIAVVVLCVLWAYAVGGERRHQHRRRSERVALSAVIGLISATALAYPIQAVRALTWSSHLAPDDPAIDFATWWGLGVGLIIAVLLARLLHRWCTPQPPDQLRLLTLEMANVRQLLEAQIAVSAPTAQATPPATEQQAESGTQPPKADEAVARDVREPRGQGEQDAADPPRSRAMEQPPPGNSGRAASTRSTRRPGRTINGHRARASST